MQKIKIRSKLTAFLIALITFFGMQGLGQVFGGKLLRGVFFSGLLLFANHALIKSNVLDYPSGLSVLYIFIVLGLLFSFCVSLDTYKLNANPTGIKLKWFNKWYFYLLYVICFICLGTSTINYKSYNIASVSNLPTLQVSDKVLTKEFNMTSVMKLHTGDFIIFTPPSNPDSSVKSSEMPKNIVLVKRIVALGGDTYYTKNGQAYLNNKPVKESFISASNNTRQDSKNISQFTVPNGYVYVLGDNRDDSLDSRNFGLVPVENIKYKVLYVIYSHDFHRIGRKLR